MKKDQLFSCTKTDFALCTTYWLPDDTEPRALVLIIHGISEHIQRYDHFATQLSQAGYLAAGCDLPGHGKTACQEEEYGFFAEEEGWSKVVLALYDLAEALRAQYSDLPLILFGHSMGSFLARTLLIDHPDLADAAILCGTGQPDPNLLTAGLGIANLAVKQRGPAARGRRVMHLVMGAYNKQFAPNRTVADWISRDESVVDLYVDDPLCSFIPTVGLFRDLLTGLRYIGTQELLQGMQKELPILLLSGEDDPVGEHGKGVLRVVQSFLSAGCRNVSLRLYPGARHELINELCKEQVYAHILGWLALQMTQWRLQDGQAEVFD